MIYVNFFNIRQDQQAIQVSVETSEGFNITSAKLWTQNTYKDYFKAIDLSYKLEQVNNKEAFLITPSDISQTGLLTGIYFLEIESNSPSQECSSCSNPMLAVTANFNPIKECMLNKILELSVCDGDIFTDSSCNSNNGMSIININLLLEALCTALTFGYYNEAMDLYNTLSKLCNVQSNCTECNKCNACDDINEPTTFSGLGYGTLNNTLILT